MTNTASRRAPESGPGPATCASTQTQSAPGTVSMPASFASWRNGRIAGSTSASADADRRRDERAWEAVREPDDEDESQSGRR